MKNIYLKKILPLNLIYLFLGMLLRITLWFLYVSPEDRVGFSGLLESIFLGFINDTVVLFIFNLVVVVFISLLPLRLINCNKFLSIYSFMLIAGMVFLFGAEVAFFEEFQSRFNLISVSYLLYPTEVIGNINQSYPMPLILSIVFVISLLLWIPTRKFQIEKIEKYSTLSRFRTIILSVLTIFIISSGFSYNSIISKTNRVKAELSANGLSGFFKALKSFDLDYEQLYLTIDKETAFKNVREQLTLDGNNFRSNNNFDLWRNFKSDSIVEQVGKMNVVILLQESLGSEWLESFGGKKGLSPNIDKLVEKSLTFTNTYATGTRTVRGIEALVASLPPIPSESIVKRVGSENIKNMGSIFRENGYKTSFIYGGYGAFDNMNHFFESNGFQIKDRLDIKDPKFSNIWGVSDGDLYDYAIKHLDNNTSSPQMLFVLSTSNHKPFTFPENNQGIPQKGGGRSAGVRYADYAISSFLKEAENHSWFNNTLFVVIADHDSRVYGKSNIPVERYKIPFLIYSPKIKPQKIDTFMSQIDIAPTIFGLLGFNYKAPFFGQNILSKEYQNNQFKRSVPLNYNFEIGLFNQESLLTLGLNDSVKAFDIEKTTNSIDVMDQKNRDIAEREKNFLVSYFQTAYISFKDKLIKEDG